MRTIPFLLVVALTACASSANPVIGTGIGRAWLVLPGVYDSLAIPRTKVDETSHTTGEIELQVHKLLDAAVLR